MTIARDVYGRHPSELTAAQLACIADFAALRMIEAEEIERARRELDHDGDGSR